MSDPVVSDQQQIFIEIGKGNLNLGLCGFVRGKGEVAHGLHINYLKKPQEPGSNIDMENIDRDRPCLNIITLNKKAAEQLLSIAKEILEKWKDAK